MDCGNKDACIYTNQRVLEFNKQTEQFAFSKNFENTVIIEPCFIGENVEISNSIIGPHVSIGNGTKISDSIVKNSIIQEQSDIKGRILENAMLGSFVILSEKNEDLSLGDYSVA